MKSKFLFGLIVMMGLCLQVSEAKVIYSNDYNMVQSAMNDDWVPGSGYVDISGGAFNMVEGTVTRSLGGIYALDGTIPADHNVEAIWVKYRVKVGDDTGNFFALGLGNATNSGTFVRAGVVRLKTDILNKTVMIYTFVSGNYSSTYPAYKTGFKLLNTEAGELQVDVWYNPADPDNLAWLTKTKTGAYTAGYSKVFDQIEIELTVSSNDAHIDEMVIWTEEAIVAL